MCFETIFIRELGTQVPKKKIGYLFSFRKGDKSWIGHTQNIILPFLFLSFPLLFLLTMAASSDSMRRSSPAAERNKMPIVEVLKGLSPLPRRILEISSGTGEHADTFCSQLRGHLEVYQPSDMDLSMFDSIKDWNKEHMSHVCKEPIKLDVLNQEDSSAIERGAYDCLININMIHISPKATTSALFSIANRVLDDESGCGLVLTYGPYRVGGTMVESNVAFDASLKSRNEEWGVRDLEWVCEEAEKYGFRLDSTIAMPANNLSCIWKRVVVNGVGGGV